MTQSSLFETRPSLAALSRAPRSALPPRAVFVGFGMASGRQLTRTLPIDALGMLLSAEQARRAAGAETLIVLLADAHAVCNGLAEASVERRADAHERLLQNVLQRLGWRHARLVRATRLHDSAHFKRVHATVERRAPAGMHPYITRQLADIEHFARQEGSLLKLGWALHAGGSPTRDERTFDACFERVVGRHVAFMYCKAGRALDDRGRKAVPYFDVDPSRRICMAHDERVHEKIARAERRVSYGTVRGVRRHLKAITRSYRGLVQPLPGSIEDQAQRMLERLLGSPTRPAQPGQQATTVTEAS